VSKEDGGVVEYRVEKRRENDQRVISEREREESAVVIIRSRVCPSRLIGTVTC
jgi:hypothetical protein